MLYQNKHALKIVVDALNVQFSLLTREFETHILWINEIITPKLEILEDKYS